MSRKNGYPALPSGGASERASQLARRSLIWSEARVVYPDLDERLDELIPDLSNGTHPLCNCCSSDVAQEELARRAKERYGNGGNGEDDEAEDEDEEREKEKGNGHGLPVVPPYGYPRFPVMDPPAHEVRGRMEARLYVHEVSPFARGGAAKFVLMSRRR